MSSVEEESFLRKLCISVLDAKSQVLECNTRAVYIVEIIVIQCEAWIGFCFGFLA